MLCHFRLECQLPRSGATFTVARLVCDRGLASHVANETWIWIKFNLMEEVTVNTTDQQACDCSDSWDRLNETYCECDANSERQCQLVYVQSGTAGVCKETWIWIMFNVTEELTYYTTDFDACDCFNSWNSLKEPHYGYGVIVDWKASWRSVQGVTTCGRYSDKEVTAQHMCF